jgi:hypothetical protein
MMLLFWGGLFAVVVVILRHFTSGSLRQRNASPLGSQRRHDHISVRACPRQQARVRRAPGASGNHIDLDQPDAITAVRSEIGSAERRLLLQSAI